ncbi:transmembrane protein [Ceratobasidium sp. AG-Ba]|nr:transmembrane protein [Ceratobasidium sp. AG-Ba]
MPNITSRGTDAFVLLTNPWEWNGPHDEDTDAPACLQKSRGVDFTVSVNFTGTALYVYGEYSFATSRFSYTLDAKSSSEGLLSSSQISDRPFLKIEGLERALRTFVLHIPSDMGAFCLGRIVWTDPNAVKDPDQRIYGSAEPNNGSWYTASNAQYNTTSDQSAQIVYQFNGTGIAVHGLVGSNGGNSSAILDGDSPVTLNSNWNNNLPATLYRRDGLPSGYHTLTITNDEEKDLTVGWADIYFGTDEPTASGPAGFTPTASGVSITQTATTSSRHGIGGGGIAGVVIILLACLGLVLFAIWFWLCKKRQASRYLYEKNQVSYDRMCSKCRKAITGDFRLECVEENCPAAIDLHPECEDWNVPDHHDHRVRPVANE